MGIGSGVRALRTGAAIVAVVLCVAGSTAAEPTAARAVTARGAAAAGSSSAALPRFSRQPIHQGVYAQVTHVNGVGDVSGDGAPDIVVGGSRWLVWFENPDWRPKLIADGSYGLGSTIVVYDLNGDGRADVLTGDPVLREMVWFENRGDGWVKHLLARGVYCHNIAFADLNGDRRVDMACADAIYGQVAWLEAPAGPAQPWAVHQIDSGRTFWGMKVADIDRDGRLDIVAGRAWYHNNGDGTFARFAYTTLADAARTSEDFPGDYFTDHEYLSVLDLNGDGRLDIVATLFAGSKEGQEWVFLAPVDPKVESWKAVEIDAGPLFSVHSQAVADFDGSGAIQVMVAEMDVGGYGFGPNPDPKLLIYRLDGPADDPASWQRIKVDSVGSHEAVAVDVNGDGRVDIIGGDENGESAVPPRNGILRWWRNDSPLPAAGPLTSTSLPLVAGTPRQGETLTAGTGSWHGIPSAFAFRWRRCSPGGGACAELPGASARRYQPTEGDIGKTLQVAVTARNAVDSLTVLSQPSAPVTPQDAFRLVFAGFVTPPGCKVCTAGVDGGGILRVRVGGGLDSVDAAYARARLGGAGGLSGLVYLRDGVGLAAGQELHGNLSVLQVRDVRDRLVYELYVGGADRTLHLWSPPGGLQAASLNLSTGVVVPADGSTTVRIEVAAEANATLGVRVDGKERLAVTNLGGATTGNQRFVRVGIDHYDAAARIDPVAAFHLALAYSRRDWLGSATFARTGR